MTQPILDLIQKRQKELRKELRQRNSGCLGDTILAMIAEAKLKLLKDLQKEIKELI